ncbi:ParB/RepB/Spo0J family partition protein [Candidatus Saccharibacteria bacterium]|nr:ParB/RepB/Spo0J family partition protein [Candidatus Saccharibacteria bacterium]
MAKTVSKGLGRGFDTLIPQDFDSDILLDTNERIQKIAIEKIAPNQDQPRKHFDQQALDELAQSIQRYGVLQPLVVSKGADDTYIIIAGERRWRAAKQAELTQLPVIVRSAKELEQLEIAIIENVQRVDLSPLEQAVSIGRLHEQFSMSYGDIAKRLGKAPTTVNNIVRLLQLPDTAKEALRAGKITEGHARAILALKGDEALQAELLSNIQKFGWSVRQAEQFVNSAKKGGQTRTIKKHMATKTENTELLSKKLGSPVTIKRTAKGGKLEIHFTDDQDLQRIIDGLA